MELRQLRYFVAVAEERRFSRAAQRLHIAAPSLSQQIVALKHELGTVLFEHTPQGVLLTSAGVVLLEQARIILAEGNRAFDRRAHCRSRFPRASDPPGGRRLRRRAVQRPGTAAALIDIAE